MSKPDCENCPLHVKHGREYMGAGWCPNDTGEASILMVGEAPSTEEVSKKRSFSPRGDFAKRKNAGWVLKTMAEDAGLERGKDYSTANSFQCRLPRKVKATKRMMKSCRATLEETVKKVKPKLIVALGASAHTALVPKVSGGVSQNGGRIVESELGPVLMTYHPAAFLHQPNDKELERFFDHLVMAKEFIHGKQRESKIAVTTRQRSTPDDRKKLVLDVETYVDQADPRAGEIRTVGTAAIAGSHGRPDKDERIRVRVDQYSGDPPTGGLERIEQLCGHNLPSDLNALIRNGWLPADWTGVVDDTMVMQSLKDENLEAALATWAMEYDYAEHLEHHHACVPLWRKGIDPEDEVVRAKNAGDVALTLARYRELSAWLDTEPQLKRYYTTFLRPAILLAARLQRTGLYIGESVLKESKRLRDRVRYRERDIQRIAKWGPDQNIRGNLNRLELLFDTLGLPVLECTETTKKPALSRSHLDQLHDLEQYVETWDQGEWVPMSLRGTNKNRHQGEWLDLRTNTWREWGDFPPPPPPKAFHVLGRYLQLSSLWKQADQLPWLEVAAGSFIHPNYNIGGTGKYDTEKRPVVTGRWSASNPSPQVFAPYLKRHVLSRYPGGYIGQWDASQMEVRIAYQYSEDPELGEIFESGRDPYLDCSTFLFGEDKAKTHRFMGKRTLLATIYGTSASVLEEELNNDLRKLGLPERVDTRECDRLIRRLRRRFAIHTDWVEHIQRTAREVGEVRSLTGRTRHLPLAAAGDRHALNQACNFPIQSLASDLNLLAALVFVESFSGGVLTTLVHDSGVVDLRSLDDGRDFTCCIRDIWQDLPTKNYFGFRMIAPLKIEVKIGRNWGEMTEVPLTGDMSCLTH